MKEINKRLNNIELWLDNMSDKNRETYSLLIKADIEAIKEQLLIHSVVSTCCEEIGEGFFLGTTCPKCKRPFRQVIE